MVRLGRDSRGGLSSEASFGIESSDVKNDIDHYINITKKEYIVSNHRFDLITIFDVEFNGQKTYYVMIDFEIEIIIEYI